jgi:hypothetical protein
MELDTDISQVIETSISFLVLNTELFAAVETELIETTTIIEQQIILVAAEW